MRQSHTKGDFTPGNFHCRLPGGYLRIGPDAQYGPSDGQTHGDYYGDSPWIHLRSEKFLHMTRAEFYSEIDEALSELRIDKDEICALNMVRYSLESGTRRQYLEAEFTAMTMPVFNRLLDRGFTEYDLGS